jgi:hypothetical protein
MLTVNTCEAYIVSTIHVHEPSANSRQPTADSRLVIPRSGVAATRDLLERPRGNSGHDDRRQDPSLTLGMTASLSADGYL